MPTTIINYWTQVTKLDHSVIVVIAQCWGNYGEPSAQIYLHAAVVFLSECHVLFVVYRQF